MADRVEERAAQTGHDIAETARRIDLLPQREDVDVIADGLLLFPAPHADRGADGDVRTGAVGRQQHVVGGKEDDDLGGPQFALQALGDGRGLG